MSELAPAPFVRCNIFALPLRPEVAHDGTGSIDAVRVAARDRLAGALEWIDYAELPPGTTIGDHRHPADEEEFYLVLRGTGVMRMEEDTFPVTAGDLLRNPAGGRHGLANTGAETLRLFIFAFTLRVE